jgi:glutathione S-transferase
MVVCALKSVPFRLDPIIPFQGNGAFTAISPLRRIPVWIDEQVTLPDSTAVAEYLDERYPVPPLFPATPAARAMVRWLEEFADIRMGEVFIERLFNAAVIKPNVWKEPRDEAVIAETLRDDLPPVMDYLESIGPVSGFVCGDLSMADIAIAVHFANLRWSRTAADLSRWPKTSDWIGRVEETPALAKLTALAEQSRTIRRADWRALFAASGILPTETTFAGKGVRKGPMSVWCRRPTAAGAWRDCEASAAMMRARLPVSPGPSRHHGHP